MYKCDQLRGKRYVLTFFRIEGSMPELFNEKLEGLQACGLGPWRLGAFISIFRIFTQHSTCYDKHVVLLKR